MDYYIIHKMLWKERESIIKIQVSLARTASPSALAVTNSNSTVRILILRIPMKKSLVHKRASDFFVFQILLARHDYFLESFRSKRTMSGTVTKKKAAAYTYSPCTPSPHTRARKELPKKTFRINLNSKLIVISKNLSYRDNLIPAMMSCEDTHLCDWHRKMCGK